MWRKVASADLSSQSSNSFVNGILNEKTEPFSTFAPSESKIASTNSLFLFFLVNASTNSQPHAYSQISLQAVFEHLGQAHDHN